MDRTRAVALFLTAAAAAASPAAAQDAAAVRPMTFGVSGGLSIPSGDFGEGAKTGFNAGAHLAFKPAMLPFGVRVEGQYNRFAAKGLDDDEVGVDIDGNAQIISGTLNGVFGVPAASSAFRPYAIGGLGVYNQKASASFAGVEVSDSRTKFGLNGGVGIEFGLSGLATFIEARYHYVLDKEDDAETGASGSNTRYIPISFGIKF